MSCSPYDLRDYLFEELPAAQQGEVRAHLKTCAPVHYPNWTPCAPPIPPCCPSATKRSPNELASFRIKSSSPRPSAAGSPDSGPPPPALASFLQPCCRPPSWSTPSARPQIVHNSAQSTLTQAELRPPYPRDAVAAQVATQVKAQVGPKSRPRSPPPSPKPSPTSEEGAQKRTTSPPRRRAEKKFALRAWNGGPQYQAGLDVQADNSRYSGMVRNTEMVRANYGSAAQ